MTVGSAKITYFINAKTYLIDKLISSTSQGETSITFSDYRKTDVGLMFPYAESLDRPSISLAITDNKVTVNSTVDPAIFNMPK